MFRSFQKIIAWFLIALLCFEATFRVPFLVSGVEALEAKNHEDIVSLLVEEELFRKISSDIDTYARRIQAQLPRTRTVIMTYPRDTHPFVIAGANERLYFSGLPNHGSKTQKLVGTILIGHVPLPVVHKDGRDFLSLYPYTDFSDPHFFWNWENNRYEYVGNKPTDTRPDIWHSVIDPNSGNLDTDVGKIRDFFARVYDYDAKKGLYAQAGKDPQVLYMDTKAESKAASKGLLSVYEKLRIPQSEHLVYHRYTREFAEYLYDNYLALMNSAGVSSVVPFASWTKSKDSPSSFLDTAADITTKIFADELLVPFLKVINEKYIGDVARWVHNTGRYYNGYSDVRVDTVPEMITKKDALSSQVLRELNDTIEKIIDGYVDDNMAMDIPLLVSRPGQKTITERQTYTSGGRTLTRQVNRTFSYTYDNYFFGKKASAITNASECSLMRGSTFGGRNTRAEVNHGYSPTDAASDSEILNNDTKAGIICKNPTQSYWGGNSPINTKYTNGEMILGAHRYDDFSLPILDLSGGKKTTSAGGTPLDCLKRDFILRPYKHTGIDGKTIYPWPVETGGARYSCATDFNAATPYPIYLDPSPEASENILTNMVTCPPAPNSTSTITLLARNGSSLVSCQTSGLTGTYKKISSLIKRTDPSRDIYGQQLQGISASNMPIDEERSLTYLNRDAQNATLIYPNLFDIAVSPLDSDAQIEEKIRTLLAKTNTLLKAGKTFSETHPWRYLVNTSNAAPNLADTLLANQDIRTGLIDALRWKHLDTEEKYLHVFSLTLDTHTSGTLLLPDKKDIYEIAYLGGQGDAQNFVFGFNPEGETDLPEWFTDIQSTQSAYTPSGTTLIDTTDSEFSLSSSEIAALLGETDGGSSEGEGSGEEEGEEESAEEGESSFECGDPEGVVIWEWLAAIQCWLEDLFNTEWITPDIDDIGFPEMPSITVSIDGNIIWSTKEVKDVDIADTNDNDVIDYVEDHASELTLTNTLSDTIIDTNQTVRVDTALEDKTYRINDDATSVALTVTQIDDLDTKKTYSSTDKDWSNILDEYVSVSGSAQLKDGHAVWVLQSKNNHRARIYIESRIYNGQKILIRSEKSVILVGPKTIPLTILGSTTQTQTIVAGEPNGITLLLGESGNTSNKADIEIYDYITGKKYISLKSLSISNNRLQIPSSSLESIIKRAGRYTLVLQSGEFVSEGRFTITPGIPHHISTTLPNILLKDTAQTLSIILQDEFNNALTYDASATMQAVSTLPISLANTSSQSAKEFSLKPSSTLSFVPKESGNITLTLSITNAGKTITQSLSRPVLSDIRLVARIDKPEQLQVGQEVPVVLSVERTSGSVVDTWDLPLTLGVRGGNASLKQNHIEFIKGRATATLITGTRASKIQFYISDTQLGTFIGDSFEIQPGDPYQLSIATPETLFAKVGSQNSVELQLRDQYGNLTDLGGHVWFFEVNKPDIVEPVTTPTRKSLGIFTTQLKSLGHPGRLLLRTWLVKDGKKSSIKTLENAVQVNILPVLTSADVANNSWKNITQILLGSVFGQTPIQGYFGGSALFSPTTQTLAITTLLDESRTPLVTLLPSGGIKTGSIKYGTGVDVRLDNFSNNILTVVVQDSRIGDLVRISYPAFSPNISYSLCSSPESHTSCDRDTMAFVPVNTTVSVENGLVYQNKQPLFHLKNIFSLPNLSFSFVNQDGKSLQFAVSQNGSTLGILALRWKERIPQENYQIQALSSSLSQGMSWTHTSSYEIPSLIVYDAQESSSYLGGSHESGWSHYGIKDGLGWTDENVALLQFASGQEWSNAQKEHADYVTINLGDPLIHLPEYAVNSVTGLDQTLGEPVYMGDKEVMDFTFRDINSDGIRDIIVFHEDGTVGTRLNRGDGEPIHIGDLLSVSNASSGMVRAGDFVGDGYADVVYVDTDGFLRLVAHTETGPTEIALVYDNKPTLGTIEQLEVFDMDHDGIDDIIILDSLGSLFIFYGQKTGIFVVQFLENVYDFVLGSEPKSIYFTGAVRYDGRGYTDPDSIKKSSDIAILAQQNLIEQSLFLDISFEKNSTTTTSTTSLGTRIYNTLDVDANGFLRMYEGNSSALGSSIKTSFNTLEQENPDSIQYLANTSDNYESFELLRAPFIDQKNLLITKKYVSQEGGDTLVSGSPIEVTVELKNTGTQSIKNIILQENFAHFMKVSDMTYDIFFSTTQGVGTFIQNGDSGIADLRNYTLSPGQSIKIVYRGTLQSFSFGAFDVGYLEDKNDPNLNSTITADKIKTINPKVSSLTSIPEKDFYNHDVFGDIRFNPNETCGGPVLLWRSHNTYDRTYHKTLIVRDIQDPDVAATEAGLNPSSTLSSYTTSTNTTNSSSPSTTSSATTSAIQEGAEEDLATWQADSDGDSIPDRGDDDYGDVFEISSSGNTTKITVGLGKLNEALDDIIDGVKKILSGLSCGFGDPGCISMPINWAANIPGNTITFMGFALPGANQPPIACYADVRCGYPIFSTPTICSETETPTCTWPPEPLGAGGGFDYYGGSIGTNYAPAGYFMPGLGVSQFRIFIGATLTGAVAEVMCFGPNNQTNPPINIPGLFPVVFEGNCIFATQPLTQCEDDGAEEDPLVTEMDVSSEIEDDNAGDDGATGSTGVGNTLTNADACDFYSPVSAYPTDLSQAATNYLTQSNETNTTSLSTALAQNTDLVTDTESAASSGLALETSSPDDSFERLNGVRDLLYGENGGGTGMIQISLDPTKLNTKGFGKVLDINLRSIKGFPDFIIDWYHRQLDEIISSLGHLPDIKIFLPDLSGLADSGWITGFASGIKQEATNIIGIGDSKTTTNTTVNPGTITQGTGTSGTTTGGNLTNTASSTGTSASTGSTSTATSSSSNTNFISTASKTVKDGWNKTFDSLQKGTSYIGNTLSTGLGYVDSVRNEAVGFVQEKTTGIRNAFEYLGTLPIIDVHPETINIEIPWVGKQEAQAWIARNQAILEAWQNLPTDAVNSVDVGPIISSIQTNIEIVRSYLELPEQLQNLFYIKEKILYGIVQNVQAVQNLLGGWLYENGLRFKAWVEVYILVTKLWDLWQILIDIFDDYEAECGVCRNERWNLQHWLWIIISMIIPPIPVIEMPRWPDIELDFSDLDLSLDIAYPVFNLSFYPVVLPDAPIPTISGFSVDPMPLLPRLPNLNIDIEIPVIQLPDLPDLPPPPKIPELSQAIEIVLEIFRIIVLVMCLYRKVPLSPEWYVGTKVAHKTERQGFLPFDFIDYNMPSVTMEWIDAIRVSTHVRLEYDVDYITDMIRDALEPFTNFPRNLSTYGSSSQVNIDINPDTGVEVNTTASLNQLPDLIAQLYRDDIAPSVSSQEAENKLVALVDRLNISPDRRAEIVSILGTRADFFSEDQARIETNLHQRLNTITDSIAMDIEANRSLIADLELWKKGEKKPEEIAWIGSKLGIPQLTQSREIQSAFLALDSTLIHPLQTLTPIPSLTPVLSVTPTPQVVEPPESVNKFSDKAPENTSQSQTRGLYVTRGTTTQRLIDYTENLTENVVVRSFDDDNDADGDVYYSLGNVVYRKENHRKKYTHTFITDAPQVYDIRDVYEDFFGVAFETTENIPYDGQINLRRSHSAGNINFKFLNRVTDTHQRLFLFRSLFERSPQDAAYIVDILAQDFSSGTPHIVRQMPYITKNSGPVFVQHKTLYRKLLPGQKYIDTEGRTYTLSSDFIIRSNQSGYTQESTTLDVTSNGTTKQYTLHEGQGITFASDSRVIVKKGSLILLSSTTEKRSLNIADRGIPLLPGDEIITGNNAGVTIRFPDGTETKLTSTQHWMWREYTPHTGQQSGSFAVDNYWYYGSMEHAQSLPENRIPEQTLFDAYTRIGDGAIVSQIPREISLVLDKATEIDFQKYFPYDTLSSVEILRLPSSEWRKVNTTTVAFEMQREKRDILVRISSRGFVRDYTTTLITRPPTLGIKSIDAAGKISGQLSTNVSLPIGIQSFVGDRSWTLNSSALVSGTLFTADISRANPNFGISSGTSSLATFDRSTGKITPLLSSTTIKPTIVVGSSLGYSVYEGAQHRLNVAYRFDKASFAQVNSMQDTRDGISVLGNNIRLETATLLDSSLEGGAYIVDTSYRPLLILDKNGMVRSVDTSIIWSVTFEGNKLVFIASRNKTELGRIIVSGNAITHWYQK